MGEQTRELVTVLSIAGAIFALVQGLFFWAYKWLLEQFDRRISLRIASFEATESKQTEAIRALELDMHKLRAELAREYVSRPDWIRFGATIDAKLDAIRDAFDELRSEQKEASR